MHPVGSGRSICLLSHLNNFHADCVRNAERRLACGSHQGSQDCRTEPMPVYVWGTKCRQHATCFSTIRSMLVLTEGCTVSLLDMAPQSPGRALSLSTKHTGISLSWRPTGTECWCMLWRSAIPRSCANSDITHQQYPTIPFLPNAWSRKSTDSKWSCCRMSG